MVSAMRAREATVISVVVHRPLQGRLKPDYADRASAPSIMSIVFFRP